MSKAYKIEKLYIHSIEEQSAICFFKDRIFLLHQCLA